MNNVFKKKLLLATVISTLFFVGWDYFFLKPMYKEIKQNKIEQSKIINDNDKIENKKSEEKVVVEKKQVEEISKVIEPEQIPESYIKIENDYLYGELSTKGLYFKTIYLKKYAESLKVRDAINLLNDNYFISFGWFELKNNTEIPTKNTVWTTEDKTLNANSTITLTFTNKDGIVFKNIISLDDKYMFTIKQVVENKSNKTIFIRPFFEIQRKYIEDKKNILNQVLISGIFDNSVEELKISKIIKNPKGYNNFQWFGISDKYWATSLINKNTVYDSPISFSKENNMIIARSVTQKDIKIIADENIKVEYKFFVGAKDLKILDHYMDSEKITLFDRLVDFGSLYILTKPMYLLLNLFNKLVGNFGIAILLLTILVKTILYPMTKKSFISMAKMKKIQPELKRLQELYKNDRLTLGVKLQQLYKNNEISPIASIIPIFIQIPVFFALYRVFTVAIDMRQAPFFGYIKDLSSADPTSIINLFGLLPFHSPIQLGFLPCLMALTMFIQQILNEKMNTPDNKNKDDLMNSMNSSMKYMPLLFLFMFSSLPTGLILYWIFNNVITIIQQIYINRIISKNSIRIK